MALIYSYRACSRVSECQPPSMTHRTGRLQGHSVSSLPEQGRPAAQDCAQAGLDVSAEGNTSVIFILTASTRTEECSENTPCTYTGSGKHRPGSDAQVFFRTRPLASGLGCPCRSGQLCPARQLALMGRAEDALQQLELCTSPDPQL